MSSFNIRELALKNTDYRRSIYTDGRGNSAVQIDLMSIKPGEDVPMEIHPHATQLLFIVGGLGIATVDNILYGIDDGSCVLVPPNTYHRIESIGKTSLKLYTIYIPPEHAPGIVSKSKNDDK